MDNTNPVMPRSKPLILILLALISLIVVVIFYFPNVRASENVPMVQIFEPDESAPFYNVIKMISPSAGLKSAVIQFIFYKYYYYGFPHFALSAASLVPLKWANQLDNIPLVFLTLRQLISLVPMLLGLLVLVYLQDGFRTYRSIALYIFLLAIPAVVRNNFWWHPDGLVVLFSSLVLFFLWKDNLRFGWRFFLAAIINGILIATKIVGVYFFLAIGLTLILGLVLKKISLRKSIILGVGYIGIMAVSFVLANPLLFWESGRTAYFTTFSKQIGLLDQGYGIVYQKGLAAAWSVAKNYYGWAFFILTALAVAIWGIIRGRQKFLSALILAWFIPLTISLIFFTHFKFQYWLPVVLPLISSIAVIFPEKVSFDTGKRPRAAIQIALILLVAAQFAQFLYQDAHAYSARLHRAENNAEIAFYNTAVQQIGAITNGELRVYYDYRLYIPATGGWSVETSYELLDYNYIQNANFDVLLLYEQRIRDYINPNVTGIDPEQFAQSLIFYTDAYNGTVQGYQLIHRDDVALIFMKDALLTH